MQRLIRAVLPVCLSLAALAGLLGWLHPPAGAAARQAEPDAPAGIPDPRRLHPALLKLLAQPHAPASVPILIEYPRDPALPASLRLPADKPAARAAVIAALQADTARRAQPILDAIALHGGASRVRAYWIAPVIALDASPALIASLSRRPDILQIRPDQPTRIPALNLRPSAQFSIPIPNLTLIRADLAHAALNLTGAGVVVANLDTGVDWTHPALQPQYRGYNGGGIPSHTLNWHDSTGAGYPVPTDIFGHGTHTMGTLAGDTTGVAPGAQWIAVKMIDDTGTFYESWAHDAFEWIIAPGGSPAAAPDIVSNSWGANFGGDPRYQPDVQALRAAGILPVFSAGNAGPFVSTITSPADYPESLAVAAVDDVALIASFSGRGPSVWNETKPDLAAPGVDVYSTLPGGAYGIADGTSMAAPHAAGVAALLLQADPALTPDGLEAVLTGSARPLGAASPNNATGWGLVDAYAAGLAVLPHGTLSGAVTDNLGGAIPFGRVTAVSAGTGVSVTVAADTAGQFSISLPPGTYTVTGSAFGYAAQSAAGVSVAIGTQTAQGFALPPVPSGWIAGSVAGVESGAPVSATVAVRGAPLAVSTGEGGSFVLRLPPGAWTLDVSSPIHRTGHQTVTVAVGMTLTLETALPSAPRLLLVDSGRWYYASQIGYFSAALDALDYPYTLRDVRDPFGIASGLSDTPVITDLVPYDLVIWSAPFDSPGYVDAGAALSAYLAQGGRVLVSGQDVAFWDGGGNLFVYPTYFPVYGGAWFDDEAYQSAATGAPDTPLAGLLLLLNTPDSDPSQFLVDSVRIAQPLRAQTGMTWDDGAPAALLSGGCHPYRLAWTGFGLEGAGPTAARHDAFDRLLAWFQTAPPAYALHLDPPPTLIGAPGETVTQALRLENTGTHTETFDLDLEAGAWEIGIVISGGITVTPGAVSALTLPGCTGVPLTATLSVPAGLPRNTYDAARLTVTSQAQPAVSTSLTLTAKTPAPLLLLDDGLFFFHGGIYAAALDSLGASYDLVELNGGALPPAVLPRYPLAIWTTGQDWFLSFPLNEEQMLLDYLAGGGRLLLTSQDLLDRADHPALLPALGVAGYRLEITPTVAIPAAGDPLAAPLTYPFVNWSDALTPAPGAQPLLLDAQLLTLGVASAPPGWRSIFYSFPLETLPAGTLRTVLMDSARWLGPFGGSDLTGSDSAPAGARLPVTLTLGWAESAPGEGLSVVLSLPAEMSPVPGSLTGGWSYSAAEHALRWAGGLAAGSPLTLAAEVDIAAGVPGGTPLTLRAVLDAGNAEIFFDELTVWVDAPRVVAGSAVSLPSLTPPAGVNRLVTFTVTATNTGWLTGSVILTDTLPAGFALITDTLTATGGSVALSGAQIRWTGSLPPGGQVEISFAGEFTFPWVPGMRVNWVTVWDGFHLRAGWSAVDVRGTLYFPFINP
jgi:uncharacterized repeat protein (TIGR01451 family)